VKNNVRRVIDANGNRACEGLRVVEEYFRMFLENSSLTEKTTSIRHKIAALTAEVENITSRDIANDPGRDRCGNDSWQDPEQLVRGNFRRIEEALRVLEEYSKLPDANVPVKVFQKLRFDVYELEKEWVTFLKS